MVESSPSAPTPSRVEFPPTWHAVIFGSVLVALTLLVILAQDAPVFDAFFPQRKQAVLKLLLHITGQKREGWRQRLEQMADPFALRRPNRQLILTKDGIVEPCVYEPPPPLWRRLARRVRATLRSLGKPSAS